VALAVLCDAWLVPHLKGVQISFRMSDDLAGVTLMAFGGAVRDPYNPRPQIRIFPSSNLY
jgi:hypothetical protein